MYHVENCLLQGASYLQGVSDRRQNSNIFVIPISNISANEKVHEQERAPLNFNVLQIKTRLVTATQIKF